MYDDLLNEADKNGLIVKEKPLRYNDGRIKGNKIAIRQNIDTETQKACVLAEELGHYYTSTGDILNLADIANNKQELKARFWAYNKLTGLDRLIDAYNANCRTLHEIAGFLEVTPQFLYDSIECYRKKYGISVKYNHHIIFFEPYFHIR